jgi:hypothetical protein
MTFFPHCRLKEVIYSKKKEVISQVLPTVLPKTVDEIPF